MGYPLITAEGAIVSWGSANFYSVLLSRMNPHAAVLICSGHRQADRARQDEKGGEELGHGMGHGAGYGPGYGPGYGKVSIIPVGP